MGTGDIFFGPQRRDGHREDQGIGGRCFGQRAVTVRGGHSFSSVLQLCKTFARCEDFSRSAGNHLATGELLPTLGSSSRRDGNRAAAHCQRETTGVELPLPIRLVVAAPRCVHRVAVGLVAVSTASTRRGFNCCFQNSGGEQFEVVAEGDGFGEGGVEGAGELGDVGVGGEEFLGEGVGIGGGKLGGGVGDDFGEAAGVADEDGGADGHGFGGREAEAFVERGVEEQLGGGIEAGHVGFGDATDGDNLSSRQAGFGEGGGDVAERGVRARGERAGEDERGERALGVGVGGVGGGVGADEEGDVFADVVAADVEPEARGELVFRADGFASGAGEVGRGVAGHPGIEAADFSGGNVGEGGEVVLRTGGIGEDEVSASGVALGGVGEPAAEAVLADVNGEAAVEAVVQRDDGVRRTPRTPEGRGGMEAGAGELTRGGTADEESPPRGGEQGMARGRASGNGDADFGGEQRAGFGGIGGEEDAERRGVGRAQERVDEAERVGADADVRVQQREAADREARGRIHGASMRAGLGSMKEKRTRCGTVTRQSKPPRGP